MLGAMVCKRRVLRVELRATGGAAPGADRVRRTAILIAAADVEHEHIRAAHDHAAARRECPLRRRELAEAPLRRRGVETHAAG